MKKNVLGFPLPYDKLAIYFDVLENEDNDKKNYLIEKILKTYKVKTVLDLTCGTGSQVLWLTKRGLKVTGVDLSRPLLRIAQQKAQEEHLNVRFLPGDMRTIKVGRFDAVITIFNAIGHLTKIGFKKALSNIHNNLKKGGLYLFDIFNKDAMTDRVVKNLAMDITGNLDNKQVRAIQYSLLNKKAGRLTYYDQFIIHESSKKTKVLKGKFTLQIYTAEELKQILAQSGFETVMQCNIDGSKFLKKTTENILTIAKKI